ncbi:HlyD family type I secretion periplasmic adaptor subunit [Legionella longbeachae]|uniref:HlyD family type I secretion periplasmic adaptor subunit n=1 Tax=Legionella longbeachae TaxID=450 RepID=UPI00124743AE|nr:HlyD family type I secretion periplasmic adaptor subunit [Legionella longbeachae]QEY51777.1 HlyD family type I secretion periplasmic adaptor subunit [Legionella longbeachae]
MALKKNKQDKKFFSEDEDFISDSKAALLTKKTVVANSILFIVLMLIISGIIWSYFGMIDDVVIGEGKVIPSSEVKIIQSLDGGIINKILVQEGEIVHPNQILVTLDDTRYKADYKNGYHRYLALSATVARLMAQAYGQPSVKFSAELKENAPDLVDRENYLFKTQLDSLHSELENLQQYLDLAKEHTKMYEKLTIKGYASKAEYIRTQQIIAEIQQKILEKKNQYQNTAWTELNQNKAELMSLTDSLASLKDKMVRTELRSLVYGVVKKINIKTEGGVVSPGEDILEIVPLSDKLLVEAKVTPKDIAFIHKGQKVSVKITAYDYTVYGSLNGVVTYISPDAIEESSNKLPGGRPITYYMIRVQTDKNYLGNDKHKLPIIPGMTANVFIKTGKKSVLDYILKPIFKAKEESFRER